MQLNTNDGYKITGAKKIIFTKTKIKAAFLSKREQEVMLLLCLEFSVKQIAYALKISIHTVNDYKKSLKVKTGSLSAVGIVRYAIRHKIFRDIIIVLGYLLESDCWETFTDLLAA